MNKRIKIEKVDHICVIVNNIEKALPLVAQIFDVPQAKIEEFTSTAIQKGRELGKYKLKLAMVKIASNLVLEFLEIVEGSSIEQEWLERHGETLHHVAVKVSDMKDEAARWEERGIRTLQEDHGKWIYLDTERILGFNIELLPLD